MGQSSISTLSVRLSRIMARVNSSNVIASATLAHGGSRAAGVAIHAGRQGVNGEERVMPRFANFAQARASSVLAHPPPSAKPCGQ